MSHVHIYRPQSWQGRAIRRCSTCKQRRRFIVTLYEWHPPHYECGGCGCKFSGDAGRLWSGQKEREKRRQRVRETWPNVPGLREAIRQMIEASGEAIA
jgi:hypothetical protein